MKKANVTPTPIFYQHLTDVIYRELINSHFVGSSDDSTSAAMVTKHEAGALRYAAGYVCRHLHSKIEIGSHEFKEELVLCLMALVRSGSHEECGNYKEWMRMIDRGRLCIKESTYSLFLAIEEETRQCLKALSNQCSKCKQEIVKMILSNEDILFYWTIASADFEIDDEEVHDVLLKIIVELYVTMRGFSYASMWMEKYKKFSKKSTQHSKSLHRDLYENN